jgi:hypothetical protein
MTKIKAVNACSLFCIPHLVVAAMSCRCQEIGVGPRKRQRDGNGVTQKNCVGLLRCSGFCLRSAHCSMWLGHLQKMGGSSRPSSRGVSWGWMRTTPSLSVENVMSRERDRDRSVNHFRSKIRVWCNSVSTQLQQQSAPPFRNEAAKKCHSRQCRNRCVRRPSAGQEEQAFVAPAQMPSFPLAPLLEIKSPFKFASAHQRRSDRHLGVMLGVNLSLQKWKRPERRNLWKRTLKLLVRM